MRRITRILLVLAAACFAEQDSLSRPQPVNIAVLDLETRGGLTLEETRSVSDRFRGELLATGRFTVLERGSMETILKEQSFQQTGSCTDAACAVEIGRLLAVAKMIGGSIGKVGSVFSVNMKIIDVQTGMIESQFADDLKCSKEELVSYHIKNIARKMAGLPELDKPWRMRWYARWYVWTPVVAAGAAIGAYVIFSDDEPEKPAPGDKMRTIPVEGTIE